MTSRAVRFWDNASRAFGPETTCDAHSQCVRALPAVVTSLRTGSGQVQQVIVMRGGELTDRGIAWDGERSDLAAVDKGAIVFVNCFVDATSPRWDLVEVVD